MTVSGETPVFSPKIKVCRVSSLAATETTLTCHFSSVFQMSDAGRIESGVDTVLVQESVMTQGQEGTDTTCPCTP